MRGFDRRRLATFVAIFALFVQGLAPVLHFALGTQLAGFGHQALAGPHPQHHGHGEGDSPGDGSHGPCHFCRITGAALPPPPIVARPHLEPARVVFAHSAPAAAPVRRPSRAHTVRGPPSSSDPQPKIAIV